MKKLVLLFAVVATFASCKKEAPLEEQTPEPTPTPAAVTYTIEFVAYDPGTSSFYTNLDVVVNGTAIGNLSNYVTAKIDGEISDVYVNGGALLDGLGQTITDGATYTIEFFNAVDGTQVLSLVGNITLEPNDYDGSNSPVLNYSTSNWNWTYLDSPGAIGVAGYGFGMVSAENKLIFVIDIEG